MIMSAYVANKTATAIQCKYHVGDVVTLRRLVREMDGIENTQQAAVAMQRLIRAGKARPTLQVHRRNAYLILA